MLPVLLAMALAGSLISLLLNLPYNLTFGSIGVLMATRLYGLRWGLFAALLAGGYLAALSPVLAPLPLLLGETLVVGLLVNRFRFPLILADGLFWVSLGLPALGLYQVLAHQVTLTALSLPLITLGLNGLGNALVARLGLTLPWFDPKRFAGPVPFGEGIYNRLLICFLIPPLLQAFLYFTDFGPMAIKAVTVAIPTLLAFILAWTVSQRTLVPLERLTKLTADLPEKLKHGPRLDWPRQGAQEIATLTENVRHLADDFQNIYRALQQTEQNARQALDELSAQRNWEVFSTGKKLKGEMDQRRRIEELHAELAAAEAKFRFLVEKTPVGVYIIQAERYTYINPRLAEIFGHDPEEILQAGGVMAMVHPDDRALVSKNLCRQGPSGHGNRKYQFRGVRKDGKIIQVEVLDGNGLYNGRNAIFGTLMDITERKMAEETINHMAYHDTLTDLPNRALFQDRMEQALAYAHRSNEVLGLMFIDLDHFKSINDTLGHAVGDAILKETASRLKICVRETDTVSRFGGDEFNLFVARVQHDTDVALIAKKIIDAMQMPFRVDGQVMTVSCSIGIALYPRDGKDVTSLSHNADIALYRAKDLGRNNYQIYAPAMNDIESNDLPLGNRLL